MPKVRHYTQATFGEANSSSHSLAICPMEIDLIDHFPKGKGHIKFVIIAIDYFTKWMEVEPLAIINEKRTTDFIWKNIICQYSVPHFIIRK